MVITPARLAGVVYVLYFALGLGAGALARGNLSALARGQASGPATAGWLASTMVYGVLVVVLVRLVWTVDARIAVAAAAFGLIGCVVQFGATILQTGREGPVAALFFFGLFMVAYGWLLIGSPVMPTLFGVAFIVAGIGWCTGAMPGLPAPVRLVQQGLGGLVEVVFAGWLLIHG